MELYIGNIPDDIDDYDLRKFFQVVGEQASFKIMTREGAHNELHRYGLASIDSDHLAIQIIKRFHGAPFKDRCIVVKAFTHRNYSNERRALNWRQVDWKMEERRNLDRRGAIVPRRVATNEGAAVFNLS